MDAVSAAEMEAGVGLVGNADTGGLRQVTLLAKESWEEVQEELGAPVEPTARRANLMVDGLDLAETTGRVLRIGGCRLEIQGETAPCGRIDEEHPGLQEALKPSWRGGAYATVLEGGEVRVGAPVRWEET